MPAVIGTLEIHIYIPEAHSLKEKRAVIKKVVEKVKSRFNVSIAEVGNLDKWQKATIGVVTIGNSRQVVDARLEKVIGFIENLFPGKITNYYKEVL
jgi:uncharacterized protein YlxP (DUF503 family)